MSDLKKNIFLTGAPQSGKTTVIKKVIERLRQPVTGFYTEEERVGGKRVGFVMKTLDGKRGYLAHKDIRSDFYVRRYGVSIENIETIAVPSITPRNMHIIVLDEIGKMECFSGVFKQAALVALDSPDIVIGTITLGGDEFIRQIKTRDDIELHEVTPENRDSLPDLILGRLESGPTEQPKDILKILLAGSSHTRLFFPYVRSFLKGTASVSVLDRDAGRTDEILESLSEWPLEDKDIIHVYSGHRDLAPGPDGDPFIGPELFRINLEKIINRILGRTSGKVVFSNIPPVSENFLEMDRDRNVRIAIYNRIIGEVTADAGIPLHDFAGFISSYGGGESKYADGLHFTRRVYQDFAKALSTRLIGMADEKD